MEQFDEIYQRSARQVYRFLLRLTGSEDLAEELTAETFYQAFLHIGRFRGECSIETWLCQIAQNAFYREVRRRKRLLPELTADLPAGEEELQRLEERQTALEIHRLLHRMEEPYREVFELRVFGELQFREIAAIFGKSESWAKMTYYRGRAKLARQLEMRTEVQEDHEEPSK